MEWVIFFNLGGGILVVTWVGDGMGAQGQEGGGRLVIEGGDLGWRRFKDWVYALGKGKGGEDRRKRVISQQRPLYT